MTLSWQETNQVGLCLGPDLRMPALLLPDAAGEQQGRQHKSLSCPDDIAHPGVQPDSAVAVTCSFHASAHEPCKVIPLACNT
jgi:hypothetical protein